MPPRPRKPTVGVAASYLDELRVRVEHGPGVTAVARAARISRQTVWRMLSVSGGTTPTAHGVESIRCALAKLEPDKEPMPPPVVAVQGRDHYAWIELAEAIGPDGLAHAAANPAAVIAAAKAPPRRRK